jgi:hypothetical protein
MACAISSFVHSFLSGDIDSDSVHVWLLGSSFVAEIVVGVGILLESKFKTWKERAAAACVMGGIVAGFAATFLLFVFDEAISSAQRAKIETQQREIVEATGRATNAGFEAATANVAAGEANERAAKLEKDAAELRAQAAELIKRANEAVDHAASTQLELTKLQAQLSWREFSIDKQGELSALARQLSRPEAAVVLFDSVVGNPEAKRYGTLLANALSDPAGAPIDAPQGLSTCVECTGVWVCVNGNADAAIAEYGKVIRGALETVGVVGAKFCTDPRNRQGSSSTVKVIVGPKE